MLYFDYLADITFLNHFFLAIKLFIQKDNENFFGTPCTHSVHSDSSVSKDVGINKTRVNRNLLTF